MSKPEKPTPSEEKGLWGGRFREGMAPEMVPLNRSLGTDHRLWPQDVRGSQAWAGALTRAGVLTQEEGETLISGLKTVGDRLAREELQLSPEEDIHSLVERLLREEVGGVAGKLHTGRSRNDQVATDFRLWGMGATRALEDELKRLLSALLSLAEGSLDLILPGYTHLQQAQPIRAAHWVMAHFWPLLRDRKRIREVWESASVLPLGSGALAGCPFPVDREWIRETLGFQRISENSLDSVSDRDWALELAFTGSLLGTHFSRLAEDLVLFSSKEFGYLTLSDGFSTGSSLMPQKRNPDVAELVRGKTGRLLGNLTGLLTMMKGLPTGYNRDLQEDKDLLFDSVDTLLLVIPALAGAMGSARFDADAMSRNRSAEMFATDLADHLVRAGTPFRESHEAVGKAVRAAEDRGVSLLDLPDLVLQEIHPDFPANAPELFSWEASVEARAVPGGTARAAVEAQILQGGEALKD
jgi:argininosuccinate lyase